MVMRRPNVLKQMSWLVSRDRYFGRCRCCVASIALFERLHSGVEGWESRLNVIGVLGEILGEILSDSMALW